MIGYDVGARFRPDEGPTGLFGRTDAPLPADQMLIDDVGASIGWLPHLVPDATDDVSEFIGALGDAPDSAGKMHFAGGVSGGSMREAASNEAAPDPADSEQGALWNSMSAIFAAQFAGSVMAGGAAGNIGLSALDYGGPSVPDGGVKVREDAAGREGLDQTHYFEQRSAQLEPVLRHAGNLDFSHASDSDDGIGDNPLAKFEDSYPKNIADLGEGTNSGNARVLGALTGSGLIRPDEAAVEPGAMFEQNDQRLFGSGYGIEQAFSKGGADAVDDWIETGKRRMGLPDFSGPEGEFYPFSRDGLAGGGIQDFAVHDISRRAADRPELFGVGIPDAGTMMLGPASDGDEKPSVGRVPDLSGLWGMLRNAERILPKPSLADTADDEQAAANEIQNPQSYFPDMLNKLIAISPASHRQQDGSSRLDERVAQAGGRSGPTGHRNDPIYTVAISSMAGTLMPLVPTPGTSTRSPPIPGQRNLP